MSRSQVTPGHHKMCRNQPRAQTKTKQQLALQKTPKCIHRKTCTMRERASSAHLAPDHQLMPVIITHALIRFVLLPAERKENKREEGCPIDNVNRRALASDSCSLWPRGRRAERKIEEKGVHHPQWGGYLWQLSLVVHGKVHRSCVGCYRLLSEMLSAPAASRAYIMRTQRPAGLANNNRLSQPETNHRHQ